MTDVVPVETPIWTLPEVRRTPAPFRMFLKLAASNWAIGTWEIVIPGGRRLVIRGRDPGPAGVLVVKDFRFVGRVMASGDIGFAEGFMAGEWDTPDLSALLEVLSLNYDRIRRLTVGNPFVRLFNNLTHFMRRNSRSGSRKNIHAHYDLGNQFYEKWLDPSMTYSSARHEHPGQGLTAAQRNKYRTLAESIGLQRGQTVLEIGCGWGGFAEYAAGEVGAVVTGITISREQFEYARSRLFRQGLADRTDIRMVDYRDVNGAFDRVASIEMFEAVGQEYWPAYFGKIHEVLKPGGRAGLQIITIDDQYFESYRRRTDFIQKYIFPGGVLPSEAALKPVIENAGLAWASVARFGQAYADTLAEWQDRFQAAWNEIRPLGFDERFRKLWAFYLSYCEAGFRTGRTDVIQLELKRA